MIILQNVGMCYGSGPDILRDVNAHLPKGSFHYLCGPSGAGKSSLLKLLYMAHRPSQGKVMLDGQDTAEIAPKYLPAIRQKIGVVYQGFHLIPSLSAFDNVALSARLHGASEQQVEVETTEMLSWVGLKMHMHALPMQLSGGQQQRLAIARAVINQPTILIADEPTGNVDDTGAHRMMCLFDELHRHGTTVVVATHNRRLIEAFPHRIFELSGGILQKGA